jgi:hypothetical protein
MASCGGGSDKKNAANEVVKEAVVEAEIKNSFSEAAAEASMKKLAGLGKRMSLPISRTLSTKIRKPIMATTNTRNTFS